MKRKIFTFILGATLLTACSSSNTTEPVTSTEATTETTTEITETTTEASKDSGTLGKYDVKIKEATFTTDHNGEKVIIINYDFTNNSEESTSALLSLVDKAFQDGIELERAYLIGNDAYDSSTEEKEIKPGITLENCQTAFILSSESPVEFEISEFISFNDKKLIKTFEVK